MSILDFILYFILFVLKSYDRIILVFNFLLQLRRERIAERIRALQELVPSVNKVNRLASL